MSEEYAAVQRERDADRRALTAARQQAAEDLKTLDRLRADARFLREKGMRMEADKVREKARFQKDLDAARGLTPPTSPARARG